MLLIRTSIAVAISLALAITLGACGGDTETDPAKLEGTWVLIQFQEGNASDPLVESTMTLKAERVSGNGGANDLTGRYEATDQGTISFTKIVSKMKAGPQEAVNQETRLLKSLEAAATFEIEEGDDDELTELELKNDLGQTVLLFLQTS